MPRIPQLDVSHMKGEVVPQQQGYTFRDIVNHHVAKLSATRDPEKPAPVVEEIPRDRWLRKVYDRQRREERNFASWVVLQIQTGATLEAQFAIEDFHKRVPEKRFQRFLAELGVLGCKIGPVA